MRKLFLVLVVLLLGCATIGSKADLRSKAKLAVESLVYIQVNYKEYSWSGSGSLLNKKEGYVLTNKHVAPEVADQIIVATHEGVTTAEVVYNDPFMDISVIKVAHKYVVGKLHQIEFSEKIGVGERILVAGHPLGLPDSITFGAVSAERIFGFTPYLQTDAVINPGNSGGIAMNDEGEFVGIPSLIFGVELWGSTCKSGIGFVIDGRTIKKRVEEFLPED